MSIYVQMHQQTDDELISRAARGERDAFTALYDRYIEKVYRHVAFKVPTQADAEDITQDVFVRAWRAISRYKRGDALFVSWLLVIARNLITDFYRARKQHTLVEDIELASGSEADPETIVENSISNDELRRNISRLKGDKQKVIIMRFIDGFSHSEISRAIGKSEGAVRVIQYRALADLKKIMEKTGRENK